MIKLFYSIIDQWPSEQEFGKKLLSMPASIAMKINQYNNYEDKVLRLYGKLLLSEGINEMDITKNVSLADITFNENGKPIIANKSIYFNTSYTGNIAVCIISTEGETGIDIEKIKPVELSLYKEYFTLNEWNYIFSAKGIDESIKHFYHLWTRKEAILKASGTGLLFPLNTIEVLNESVTLYNKAYYLKRIDINKENCCCIATEYPFEHIEIIKVTN